MHKKKLKRCVKDASRLNFIPTIGAFYNKRFTDFGLKLHRFINKHFFYTVLELDSDPALNTENTSNIGM